MASSLVAGAALAVAVCASGVAAAAADTVPAPAGAIDLQRWFGRWYVLARMPADNEPAVGAYLEFTPRPDGRIRDVYYARPGSFERELQAVERVARPDPEQPARWHVRRSWLSSEERLIVYVSPDYRHALAVDPEEGAGWVLAREPVIPEWSYAGLVARLAMQGYDVSRLRKVPQRPEQLGQPGFE